MKNIKLYLLGLTLALSATSCFDDDDIDDNLIAVDSINDFVWKGMNAFYLYGEDVPNLTNDRFGINGFDNRFDFTEEYSEFLNGFSTPEALFESLLFQPGVVDRFSAIFPDLFEIIQALDGTTETNGLEFSVFLAPGSDTEVFAVIRLVLNGSPADLAGLQRGMIISGVDGTPLNRDNFGLLLTQETTTFNFADYNTNDTDTLDDDTIIPNEQSLTVSRTVFTENPVHRTEVLNVGGETIGYIAYNSFNNNFETELNAAFGELQAANVEHLVLDLRYNGGGVINTATALASMITGQFNGEPFANNINGPNRQDENFTFNFPNTIDGGAAINSLNLDRVYVIATNNSASASELIINSLRPYIEVVHIGSNTSGKTTSNRLVLDSPNFGTQQVNASHTYALFPLIGTVTNSNDELVPDTGLVPNIGLVEFPGNFGSLGNPNEPLLAAAIADITGAGRAFNNNLNIENTQLTSSKLSSPLDGYMYIND